MKYSIIAFILTLIEVGTMAAAYALGSVLVFSNVVIYGSPIYTFMTLLNSGSAFLDKNPIYMVFVVFHVIKYFCFLRAQLKDDDNKLRVIAIILEAIYLATSAYYIY